MFVRDLSFTVQLTHWAKQYLGNSEEGVFLFFFLRHEGAWGWGGGGSTVMIFLCVIYQFSRAFHYGRTGPFEVPAF